MHLDEKQLYDITGGAVTAAMLNAAARAVNTILEVGRTIGSSIRRIFSRSYC